MAYSELIKNFENIRDYISQFYVYGFKRRKDYDKKSSRSYDNERRRIESWLGEYMCFTNESDGKSTFCHLTAELFCIIRYIRHLRRKALPIRI